MSSALVVKASPEEEDSADDNTDEEIDDILPSTDKEVIEKAEDWALLCPLIRVVPTEVGLDHKLVNHE